MPETEDLYEILQVHPSAHPDVILAAYRRLTLLYHPDRNPSQEAAEMMTRLNLAYETLSYPDRRAAYDRAQVTQQAQRTETGSRDTHSGQPRQGNPARGSASQSRTATQTTPPKTGITKADKITVGAIGLAVVAAIVMSAIFSAGRPSNGDDGDSRSVVVLPTETPIPPTITSVPASRSEIATLAPKPTPTSLPPPTVAPTVTPQLARVGYFTIGSSQEEVNRIQGPPSGIHTYASQGYEHWYYSSSRVTFSLPERQVKEWVNKGNLKVRLGEASMPTLVSPARATPTAPLSPIPTPKPTATLTPRATPTPTPLAVYTPMPTHTPVPLPTVTPYPTATPKPAPTLIGNYFTRGSSQDNVLYVQGTPDEIKVYSASREEIWHYGNPVYVRSTVTFSLPDRRVKEWANGDGSLKARLLPKTSQSATPGYFTRGSSHDDVLHVQGTPDEIKVYSVSREEVWYYGNPVYVRSTVTFSLPDRRVKEWANGDGSLMFRLELSDSSPGPTVTPTLTSTPLPLPTVVPTATSPAVEGDYFTRGSSQDDVLHAQGTPTGVDIYPASGKEVWSYGYSSVTFSTTDGRVIEWSDFENNLKVRYRV